MLAWITGNAVTIIAAAIVIILVGTAVLTLVKDKKNNKGGCTGNCATCGMCCSCGKKR